ncbi:MAG: type IV secretory system conjugative DNA transfer family protein [Parcubacteria group bacterium]|nr:type IV secretory system conjugative DNA transfer family protein [Parcubacteria group bacterium]
MSVVIGNNVYRNKVTPIRIDGQDRLSHMYMLGKTGVGKSAVFQNMCLQDITHGQGVCFLDPHGDSIEWLIGRIPADRLQDVILFDPADIQHPFGLNLLEAKDNQEKDFLVAECIQIFYKLFDPEKTGIIGPQFEHWLRNAALTVMAGSEGGSIIEIPKLFVDKRFEAKKRAHVKDPLVLEFWSKQMAKTSDFHRSEMLNYFMSKFGHFMNNAIMRNIIGHRESSFRFDDIIAQKKILLVNLSKGKIGEINAQMLGLILVAKLQAAILKRARQDAQERTPFLLYVDEFQNFITDTFASMLSESRKYGLGVHLTNQYFGQMPKKIQDAVLGNTGTVLVFAVSAEDAETLSKEFTPFVKEDFTTLPRFHFYIKLMAQGKTTEAFSGVSLPPEGVADAATTESVVRVGRLAYGFPKLLVDERIKEYMK